LLLSLSLVEDQRDRGLWRNLDRHERAGRAHIVFGILRGRKQRASRLARVLKPQFGDMGIPAFDGVARARPHLALHHQLPQFDLIEGRALLHVFRRSLDGKTRLKREGNGGAGADGKAVDHTLAKKTAFAEKGQRATFE